MIYSSERIGNESFLGRWPNNAIFLFLASDVHDLFRTKATRLFGGVWPYTLLDCWYCDFLFFDCAASCYLFIEYWSS